MAASWNVGIIGTPKPDDDPEKNHPGVKVYRSSDAMFKDSEIDVVVVGTTPTTHFDLTKSALESAKHVIVEKPFTPTSKEAFELDAIAKKHGKVLAVYQNYLTLRKVMDEGRLGQISEFETHFDRHRLQADKSTWKGNPAPGGGVVYDLGTHLMDQVVHCFGMPKRITGFVFAQREGNDNGLDDACTILLHYDQMLATAKAAVISPEVNQLRYWVRGTKGSFKKFHLDVQEQQLKDGLRPKDKDFGVEPTSHHAMVNNFDDGNGSIENVHYETVQPATYAGFYAQFALALQGAGKVPVSAEEGANVIKLVELAKRSSEEGRTLEVN